MYRIACLPLLLLLVCFGLALPACAKETQLHSKAMVEAFGEIPPLSMSFGRGAAKLAEARDIPLIVAAYGSGYDIHVDLILADPQAEVTREELARAAMAAALALYQLARSEDDEDRPCRASIYPFYTGSYEYNVMLASAVFDPKSDSPRDFAFPGPAWLEVKAAERNFTDLEIKYLQQVQDSLYAWGIRDFESDQEDMRPHITAAQDAEVSGKLRIKPGSVNLSPLILRSLIP